MVNKKKPRRAWRCPSCGGLIEPRESECRSCALQGLPCRPVDPLVAAGVGMTITPSQCRIAWAVLDADRPLRTSEVIEFAGVSRSTAEVHARDPRLFGDQYGIWCLTPLGERLARAAGRPGSPQRFVRQPPRNLVRSGRGRGAGR